MPARRENGPVNRRGTLGQGRGAAGRDWSGGPATGQFQFAIPQGDPLESRLTRLHPLANPRGVEGVDGQHVAALDLPPFGGDPGPFQLLHEGFDQGLGREWEPARLQPHEFNAQAMVGSDGEPEPGAGDGLGPARGLEAGGEHAFVGLKLQAGLRNAGGPEAGVPGFDLTDEPGIDLPVGEPEGEGRFVAKFVEKLQGLLIGLLGELACCRVAGEQTRGGGIEGRGPGPGRIEQDREGGEEGPQGEQPLRNPVHGGVSAGGVGEIEWSEECPGETTVGGATG